MVDEDNDLKAFVFDLIVSEKYRGDGLGKELMVLTKNHLDLKEVKHKVHTRI